MGTVKNLHVEGGVLSYLCFWSGVLEKCSLTSAPTNDVISIVIRGAGKILSPAVCTLLNLDQGLLRLLLIQSSSSSVE
jgi:hypothetical protein